MTTVFWVGKIKFKINPKDHNPPHVHVEAGGEAVRINLVTLEQMDDTGFSRSDLRKISEAIAVYREQLLMLWEEYHGEKEKI